MQIAVLGTGMVGETLASALAERGHSVMMGSRTKNNEKATAWAAASGGQTGTFADAATFAEVLFLCLNGAHTMDAIGTVDPATVAGKLIVDVTNPLDFSKGMPPSILPQFREVSLGEQIQAALPEAHVVKGLNTVNCRVMVAPQQLGGGNHQLFICGNNAAAKDQLRDLLSKNFGWKPENLLDLGGIAAARTTEAVVPFWVMLMQAKGTPMFNFSIVS